MNQGCGDDDSVVLVFGYGSILWKQEFEHTHAFPCYITGYKRVFHQGSRDHRGAPDKPGRVVTIIPSQDPQSRVDGMAFQLPTERVKREEILKKLDWRERGGYERVEVKLYLPDSHTPVDLRMKYNCLCYMATEDNEEYLGEATEEEIAAQILECKGMSGTNCEYLFKLADSLRSIDADDPHVFGIEEKVKKIARKS